MTPTIGRIVHYTLSVHDAEAIQARRTELMTVANLISPGDIFPAVVVRTFGADAANLRVLLDGDDIYWATSRTEGAPGENGHWTWPPRV